jgi:hypothetical protein
MTAGRPPIRVLRLADSLDRVGDIAPEARSAAIAERALAEASGRPVETVARAIWPDPRLPELVTQWLDRYKPDIVTMTVASYPVAYPSVPLKLQRRAGWPGELIGGLGLKAAGQAWLSQTSVFKALRRTAVANVGGAYYFEPEAVVQLMDDCFRRILRLETVALGVRGPRRLLRSGTPGSEESEARRAVLREGIAELCRQLHVPFRPFEPAPDSAFWPELQATDGVHSGPQGHAIAGAVEAEVLVSAWKQACGVE